MAVVERRASVDEIRQVGMMMNVLMQAWAGALGSGPQPGSPLAQDLEIQEEYATSRLPTPFGQAWAFAQTIGLAALNHEQVLQESLLRNANNEGSCPIAVIDTLTRAIVELLALQTWLTDPHVSSRDRFVRWVSIECSATRGQWRLLHPGRSHEDNLNLRALLTDAKQFGLAYDERPGPKWIGTEVPAATSLVGELFEKHRLYGGLAASMINPSVGEFMYRHLSSGVHGEAGYVLSALLPTETGTVEHPVVTYTLSSGSLWRAATVFFLTTFVARSSYAAWLAIEVPTEAKRISLHHLNVSVGNLGMV